MHDSVLVDIPVGFNALFYKVQLVKGIEQFQILFGRHGFFPDIQRPPEEWLIFENTHEAIVDEGTWKLAQKAKQAKKRTDSNGIANPLTGLMYCADCGAKMYNHKGMHQAHTKRYEIDPTTGRAHNGPGRNICQGV